MLDRIGTTAVRSLGTDIANLTSRLAVQGAVLEELIAMAREFDMEEWTHTPTMDEDDQQIGSIVTVPVAEYQKVMGILSLINSLQ